MPQPLFWFLMFQVTLFFIWNFWGSLPFFKKEVVFHLQQIEVVFHLNKNWGRLPFKKLLRLSSIFKKFEVVFHFQKNWSELGIAQPQPVLLYLLIKLRTIIDSFVGFEELNDPQKATKYQNFVFNKKPGGPNICSVIIYLAKNIHLQFFLTNCN